MNNCVLPYLEFHLTDHCNLNCKACSHYSPVAEEYYLPLDIFLKDMKRLSEIFSNITKIRILGGEPLLHTLVANFAAETRRIFPQSKICIVTNAILLPQMDANFYETLKKHDIILDISVYPTVRDRILSLVSLAGQYEIEAIFTDVTQFRRDLNPRGDSDGKEMFKQCSNKFCTFLREGKLFHCRLPALAEIPNTKFGLTIPCDCYIDLHTGVSATDILEFLAKPSSACAYCQKGIWFPWELSQGNLEEWLG